MVMVAVVVPVFNRRDITLNFLQQFGNLKPEEEHFDIVIVDDGSTDGTGEAIGERYPSVTILKGDGNLWWTGAVRKGVEYALVHGYDSILIMNDDVEMAPDFRTELMKAVRSNPGALVSSIKLNHRGDGTDEVMTAGFHVYGRLKRIEALHCGETYSAGLVPVLECDILTGSSLFIPAVVFRQVGLFDDQKFPHHWGDFEFTRRASLAGFRCLVATRSKVYTKPNINYSKPYLLKSSRLDFLGNLFNNTKHFYGFKSLTRSCFLHKGFFVGSVLFTGLFIRIVILIILKLVMPNRLLMAIFHE